MSRASKRGRMPLLCNYGRKRVMALCKLASTQPRLPAAHVQTSPRVAMTSKCCGVSLNTEKRPLNWNHLDLQAVRPQTLPHSLHILKISSSDQSNNDLSPGCWLKRPALIHLLKKRLLRPHFLLLDGVQRPRLNAQFLPVGVW